MGMDLIGAGFTHDSSIKCNTDAIGILIDRIPDEKLMSEDFLNTIDESGNFMDDVGVPGSGDGGLSCDDIRGHLKAGAQEYANALEYSRASASFDIEGTLLHFVFMGGDSWGDDPFDGFTDLCYFLNYLGQDRLAATTAGFVCGGLPDAKTVYRSSLDDNPPFTPKQLARVLEDIEAARDSAIQDAIESLRLIIQGGVDSIPPADRDRVEQQIVNSLLDAFGNNLDG